MSTMALAAPAEQAAEDMDIISSGLLTAEDLQRCGSLDRRWERRECREERREERFDCRRWGRC